MGVPFFKVKAIVDKYKVSVFSSNYTLYADMSRRVMQTLSEFTPSMEVYSIDEAFLDLSGFVNQDLDRYGRQIRSTVLRWTGIPVSVGIASTKTLAKIANRIAKRSSKAQGALLLTDPRYLDHALKTTPVEKIWGVGSRTARKLQNRQINTAQQLRDADDKWILKKFGIVGLRTVHELRGSPCYRLEESPPPKKSVTVSRTFGHRIESIQELREATASYSARAGEKLRAEGRAASVMTVYVMTNIFKDTENRYFNSVNIRFSTPTNDSRELVQATINAVDKLYRKDVRFKKSGVILDGLVPANQIQLSLFDKRERKESERLMQTLDIINTRHPLNPVMFGAEGLDKPWKVQFNYKTQRYTTRFDELLVVKP
jgi:DNA polymerase V